jgi:hypothetical protein
MAQNKSLRINLLALYYSAITPQIFALFGMHPANWDVGKIATENTVRQGLCLQANQGISLCAKVQGVHRNRLRCTTQRAAHGVSLGRRDGQDAPPAYRCEVGKGWAGIDSQLDEVPLRPPLHDFAGDWHGVSRSTVATCSSWSRSTKSNFVPCRKELAKRS